MAMAMSSEKQLRSSFKSSVGIRVVRGPDWKWGMQDGGEGNIGTVVEICKFPKRTVLVKWDLMGCSNYKIGFEKQYDLRIFDNSQMGILHSVACNECKIKQITGLRYSCNVCVLYNLCKKCYHSGKHNLSHEFTLFSTTMSSGNSLPKREDENQDFQKSRINYYVTHLPVLGKLENEIVVMEPTSDTILNQLIQEVDSWQNRTKIPSETPVCLLCDKTSEHNVTFIPCNHKLACTNCSIYVKKCYSCHVSVEKRVAPDGTDLPIVCKYKDRLDAIRSQLLRIEENFACGICMENIIDIAFECGHRACSRCIENLRGKCHMCRQPISMTIEI